MFIPTDQHHSIHAALFSSSSNLIIEACAGSGKTTTATWLAGQIPRRKEGQLLDQSITFLAFNRSIAEVLKTRLPSYVAASTFHSLGLSAVKTILGRNIKVDNKGEKVTKLLYANSSAEDPDFQTIKRLVSLVKNQWPLNLTSTLVEQVAAKQDLELLDPRNYNVVLRIVERSIADKSSVDFDDMLLLPLLLDAEFCKQDFVFVDEAQDTNDIQLGILTRLQKPSVGWQSNAEWEPKRGFTFTNDRHEFEEQASAVCARLERDGLGGERIHFPIRTWISPRPSPTRFVFVGDPHQAIYAFRGANADSMDRIKDRFSCLVLPLDVSYRCPQRVVAEAQKQLQNSIFSL